jgi:Nucleotidyl transferase AbiEii toxin, Type IV TA system
MPLDELHRQVAAVALDAAQQHGFALGGGNALIAHGIIDRPTEDVDLFSAQAGAAATAAAAVEKALRAAGLHAEREDGASDLGNLFPGFSEDLIEWVVTAPEGRQIRLQLAYIGRSRAPVTMDIGPVLDMADVIGSKVAALASRAEVRDFVDVAAALGHYSVAELIALARQLDPGLTDTDFADAGRRLDRVDDEAFTRYGLTPHGVSRLRERLAAWPRT